MFKTRSWVAAGIAGAFAIALAGGTGLTGDDLSASPGRVAATQAAAPSPAVDATTQPVGPSPPNQAEKRIASVSDTVGELADTQAGQLILVRGYGLVILPQPTGGGPCPPAFRKIIMDKLNQAGVGEGPLAPGAAKLDAWIDSPRAAAVEVRGLMPGGGVRDQGFDVLVTALPGTQTSNLDGGVLIATDLAIWRRGVTGGLIHGKTIAVASGPIFVDPLADPARKTDPGDAGKARPGASMPDDSAAKAGADLRRGWVLGGGLVLKDQPLQLLFREPSYHSVARAAEQINLRFPIGQPDAAVHPVSASVIELKVPPEYRNEVDFWLELVRQTYLRREPDFLPRRSGELAVELASPAGADADRRRVSMTFIAIGKPALPTLREFYRHKDPSVAFHACYAGLRIGDGLALRELLERAVDKGDRTGYRLKAVEALGQPHRFANIADYLVPLLNEEDPQLRIAAYRALRNLKSKVIRSETVGLARLGFELDLIDCKGPALVFVAQSSNPRIALFGGDSVRAVGPISFRDERTGVTVTGQAGDPGLAMARTDPSSGREMTAGFKSEGQPGATLADVIRVLGGAPQAGRIAPGPVTGLGLSYGQVAHVLCRLARDKMIAAEVRLESVGLADSELLDASPSSRPEQDAREIEKPDP